MKCRKPAANKFAGSHDDKFPNPVTQTGQHFSYLHHQNNFHHHHQQQHHHHHDRHHHVQISGFGIQIFQILVVLRVWNLVGGVKAARLHPGWEINTVTKANISDPSITSNLAAELFLWNILKNFFGRLVVSRQLQQYSFAVFQCVGADFPALNVRRHFFENVDRWLYSVVWETAKTRHKTVERLMEDQGGAACPPGTSLLLSTAILAHKRASAAMLTKREMPGGQEVSVITDAFSCFSSHLVTSSKSRGWFAKHPQLRVLPCVLSLQKLQLYLYFLGDEQLISTWSTDSCFVVVAQWWKKYLYNLIKSK